MNIPFKDLMLNDPLLIKDSYGNKRAEVYFTKGNYVTIDDIDLGKSFVIYKEHLGGFLYQLYRINLPKALNNLKVEVFKKNGKKRI